MRDLRQLFHQLHQEDLRRVPSPRLRGEGAPKARMRGWAYAFALIVIAVIVALSHRRPPVTESIVTWKAPTDFLLRTPGSEVLSAVPQIPERR